MKQDEKTAGAAMRAGFTLIEILVAVAIIGIMGAVAVVNVTKFLDDAKKRAAREAVTNIKGAVVAYNMQYKKYPNDLNALITASGDDDPILDGGEGALEDPWGAEYKYERNGRKIVIVSAGPDGNFGTDDDIRSDKLDKSTK